jgi:hypothetical protein
LRHRHRHQRRAECVLAPLSAGAPSHQPQATFYLAFDVLQLAALL